MRANLAIFDMDGTLFDTKRVNFESYRQAIESVGLSFDADYTFYCQFCNGRYYKDFLPVLIPGITSGQMEAIHEKKGSLYPKYLYFARKNNHLFRLIELMRAEYIIAMVTTASRRNVNHILQQFDVESVFDFILTQEDVQKKKPNPECFFRAMERAKVDPANTIIFEDSQTGLEAAESAGVEYVKVFGYN